MTGSGTDGTSILGLLERRARRSPDRIGYAFAEEGSGEVEVSFGELRAAALALARTLSTQLPEAGRAVLGYPSGRRYLEATFACLYAGIVPVSGHVAEFGRAGAVVDGLVRTARATGADAVLARPRLAAIGREVAPELAWPETDREAPEGDLRRQGATPAVAYVQTTSGSTGAQKGVVLSDRNLLANLKAQNQLYPLGEGSVAVSWLPMSHDMGFVGPLLQPLHSGSRTVFLPPLRFVADPASWLRAIARLGAEVSGCPNFGYDHLLRRVAAGEVADVDLSCWRCAISGGEPIRPDTLERFAATFGAIGFEAASFVTGYGLAEATSVVTAAGPGTPVRARTFDRGALSEGRAVVAEGSGRRLVGHGWTAAEHAVLIVDPTSGEPLPPGRVGEIWVSGPSVAVGYLDDDEGNAAFGSVLADGSGPFLRTGDEGFVFEGELFVSGRSKELIIVRGVNHAPQDLEATARQASETLAGARLAAVALPEENQEERVLLGVELSGPPDGSSPDRLAEEISSRVIEQHGVRITDLVFLPEGAIPVTNSGKIRRREFGRLYLNGELPRLAAA